MVEFKNNFKSKYGNNLDCSLCGGHIEDQEGQLSCPEIVSEVDTEHVRYNDIFENLDKQVVAIKVWKQILRVRKRKLNNKSISSV